MLRKAECIVGSDFRLEKYEWLYKDRNKTMDNFKTGQHKKCHGS